MFQSIGGLEVVTIAIVALIVFGPRGLPDMARKIGRYVSEFRAAAADMKKGLDAELAELREPIDAVKTDLTKPVSDLKETLAETADAVKQSSAPTTEAAKEIIKDVKSAGRVEWVGAEPSTGVSPSDAWEGMDDDGPDDIRDAPTEIERPDGPELVEHPDRDGLNMDASDADEPESDSDEVQA